MAVASARSARIAAMGEIDLPNPLPESAEGPEAFRRFDTTMKALLAVPHSELERREKAYRRKVDRNPNRPGPKRKVKPSASNT